jgi:hypothetical protein
MLRVAPINVAAPLVPVVVSVIAFCLLLKVVQFAALNAPLLAADAVGTFNVITGVVVLFATVLDKSVPLVPKVIAATLVTVPPLDGLVLVIVKFGYVPDVLMPVPAVNTTVWSGAVFVIVSVPLVVIGEPLTEMPVPADAATEVTVPVFDVLLLNVVQSVELKKPL